MPSAQKFCRTVKESNAAENEREARRRKNSKERKGRKEEGGVIQLPEMDNKKCDGGLTSC